MNIAVELYFYDLIWGDDEAHTRFAIPKRVLHASLTRDSLDHDRLVLEIRYRTQVRKSRVVFYTY